MLSWLSVLVWWCSPTPRSSRSSLPTQQMTTRMPMSRASLFRPLLGSLCPQNRRYRSPWWRRFPGQAWPTLTSLAGGCPQWPLRHEQQGGSACLELRTPIETSAFTTKPRLVSYKNICFTSPAHHLPAMSGLATRKSVRRPNVPDLDWSMYLEFQGVTS